ncbi:MAG: hypothetical protein Ta2A_03540 [Treponemataceae bacterium]|nr:MAG: hypothetical protein Ta2A_03540 [Treponemataceae bacterium]
MKGRDIVSLIIAGLLCFSLSACFVKIFWDDLNTSLLDYDRTVIGTVTYKNKVVERRFVNRVAWNRVPRYTPVYDGDYIHTADQSEASINYDTGLSIDLMDNSLIQVFLLTEKQKVVLSYGQIIFKSADFEVIVTAAEKDILVAPNSIVDFFSEENGHLIVRVVQGSAIAPTASGSQLLKTGEAIDINPSGEVNKQPILTVLSPELALHYDFLPAEETLVDFSWNILNSTGDETVRLEFASDRTFSNVTFTHDVTDGATKYQPLVPKGSWWWRVYMPDIRTPDGGIDYITGKIIIENNGGTIFPDAVAFVPIVEEPEESSIGEESTIEKASIKEAAVPPPAKARPAPVAYTPPRPAPALPPQAELVITQDILPPQAELVITQDILPPQAELVIPQDILPPQAELVIPQDILPPQAELVILQDILPPLAEAPDEAPQPDPVLEFVSHRVGFAPTVTYIDPKTRAPIDLSITAGYAPFVPLNGYLFQKENENFTSGIYPAGADGTVSVPFLKKKMWSLGAALSVVWGFWKNTVADFTVKAHVVNANLDVAARIFFNSGKTSLNIGAGAGVVSLLNYSIVYPVDGSAPDVSNVMPAIHASVFAQQNITKLLFFQLGATYTYGISTPVSSMGFLNPSLRIGFNF